MFTLKDRLEELEKLMEDTYRLTSQSTPIEDGMICIASVDNLYHRARVYSLIDGKVIDASHNIDSTVLSALNNIYINELITK